MESWYGLWWNHNNKHRELLRDAERDRLANAFPAHRSSTVHTWAWRLIGVVAAVILVLALWVS